MATVNINLPHCRYDVRIEPNALSSLGPSIQQVAPNATAALLADQNVFDEHGMAARESLSSAGYNVVADGLTIAEEYKNLEFIRPLYELLVDARLERGSPVIALGGGVTGDAIGFLASTYLRGVPFIQCPTTLLAMVDASVGGKVGVNLPQGKNLVGCFYQPKLVVIDTDTLSTLPVREMRCGLAECVKHAMIRDADRFTWLENNLDRILKLDSDALVELVEWNVRIKANVVMNDERETGERAHLNFGHTFAHAIEATAGYGAYHHGEAVSLGMIAAARLTRDIGKLDPDIVTRLIALLERIGLPTSASNLAQTTQLTNAMRLDKKVKDGRIRVVLVESLGTACITDEIPVSAIESAWDSLRQK